MADYVTQSELAAEIPAQLLLEALDDDGDGVLDDSAWAAVLSAASTAVDGFLAARYTVPFTTPPAPVKAAAFAFAGEMVYSRRGTPTDKNPFTKRADYWRTQLAKIGAGNGGLESETDDDDSSAAWGSKTVIATRTT